MSIYTGKSKGLYVAIFSILIYVVSVSEEGIFVREVVLDVKRSGREDRDLEKELSLIVNGYEGKELKGSEIEGLLKELNNKYIEFGYVGSRAYLPEQNLLDGKLEIKILEGFVEGIELEGGGQLPLFLPVSIGSKLSLRDVEQLHDHYSYAVDSDISIIPGEIDGSSKLFLKGVGGASCSFDSSIDNSGSKENGRLMGSFGVSLENLLNQNGIYRFGSKNSLEGRSKHKRDVINVSVSYPIFYNRFTYSYSRSKNEDKVNTSGNSHRSFGKNELHKYDINRIVYRSGRSKVGLSVGYSIEKYNNYFDEDRIEISSYNLKKKEFGMNVQGKIGGGAGSIVVKLSDIVGLGYTSSAGGLADERSSKLNVDASWFRSLKNERLGALQYRIQFIGQYSNNLLVSSEKLSLGGIGGVRGFKDYVESSDSGVIIREELSHNILRELDSELLGAVKLVYGFDIGRYIDHRIFGVRSGWLSGCSVGISSSGIMDMNITLGRSLNRPSEYKNKSTEIYVNLGFKL